MILSLLLVSRCEDTLFFCNGKEKDYKIKGNLLLASVTSSVPLALHYRYKQLSSVGKV